MPFDAMKGLQEALRDREERHVRSERRELSEEHASRLNTLLQRLRPGMRVRLECYYGFHDVCMEGRVRRIRAEERCLQLDEADIAFEDIYTIEILDVILFSNKTL